MVLEELETLLGNKKQKRRNSGLRVKKRYIKYNRERAYQYVHNDYSYDCTHRRSSMPVVKCLAALKMLCYCYGLSFSAFQDYFQMRGSTARLAMRKDLNQGIG